MPTSTQSRQSLHAASPEAGLALAQRFAETLLAQTASAPGDVASQLRAAPAPHLAALTAQLFVAVAAANDHWTH